MLFGAHVSSAGGISNAIDRIEEIGGNALQVFTQSPRMWKPTAHPEEELARFRERRSEARVGAVLCHAVYLVNLASRDADVRKKSFASLEAALETARGLAADAVVFHVGSHLGYGFADAVEVVTGQLRELLELTTDELWLCLENTAGAGGTIGRSFGELAQVITRAGGDGRLGVCLDTQHLWASGVRFGTLRQADAVVRDLDATVGLERLACLHVNDSKVGLGAGVVRHENPGEGKIGVAGFRALLGHPALQELPAVLEVPGIDNKGPGPRELATLRRFHRQGLALRRFRTLSSRRNGFGGRSD